MSLPIGAGADEASLQPPYNRASSHDMRGGRGVRHLDDSSLEARLEVLCAKGCRQVRCDIAALESGAELPETQGLTADERARLLAELKQIMAVYGDTCRL
ncbi:MAG: hypothetical protein MZV65_43120 [Chromatiales bacterium]|nr:hypothetical protein [Chromatiales bacterium]